MAELADVEKSLLAFVIQTLYPDGTGQPSALASPCKAYRGWPVPAQLDADLAQDILNVSIWPHDIEQRITRYLPNEQPLPVATPSLTLTAAPNSITVGGVPSSPLNAAAIVNGRAYVYPVQPADTLNSIATGLATLINADAPATSHGTVITIPGAKRLIARVGAIGQVAEEIRRQKRQFMVTLWCGTPAQRDAASALIDAAFADLDFISLPDGTAGRLLYERTRVSDSSEKARLYRRDFFYSVEYGTTRITSAAQIVAEIINVTAEPGGNIATIVI